MSSIELYDTTLRDGMQGEGMSLSAVEKLRVAHRLDELGIDLIEAGFPSSNPKEAELFGLLADEPFAHAEIAAFGMTRRRDLRADQDPALRVIADCFAPVCTLVGKSWGLHLEKVVKVDHDENLRMIADSVAFLVAEGKRVIYDAEHFFDGFADDSAYALRCLQTAAEAGAETVVCCDTNGGTLPHTLAATMAEVVAALASADAQVGDPHPRRCRLRRRQRARRGASAGATQVQGTVNGYGERCGNANLISIIPDLQLKLGYRVCDRRAAAGADADVALPRRAAEPHPRPGPAVRRPQCVRAQGRDARRRGRRRPADVRAHRARAIVGNRREVLVSELSGKGTVQARAADAGNRDRRRGRRTDRRARQAARAPRLPLRGRGRLVRAAAGKETGDYEPLFRLEAWRVHRREARGRPCRDRGDDQDLGPPGPDGERYVRTAEGNGPVHALDRALRRRAGRDPPRSCARSSWSTSRCGSWTRPRAPTRSPGCCWMPPTASGSGARSGSRRT